MARCLLDAIKKISFAHVKVYKYVSFISLQVPVFLKKLIAKSGKYVEHFELWKHLGGESP